jgi:hypothetical protein
MGKSLHRKILIVSIIGVLIFGTGLIACFVFKQGWLIVVPLVLTILPVSSLIALAAIKFQSKSWFRKTAKYSLFLFPFILAAIGYIMFLGGQNPLLIGILATFTTVISYLCLIHFFIYKDATSLSGFIIILIAIFLGIFLKRNHLMFAGITLSIFSMYMSVGSLMFGIRCLFISENIVYFRNVTFIGCCIISIAYLGQMFKLQHWPGAGIFLQIGLTSLIIVTLYILLTLHSSGFIDWKLFHKSILGKILIPWTFIFIMYISRFMVPELYTLIWSPDSFVTHKTEEPYGFNMKDYNIDNNDLIKPE